MTHTTRMSIVLFTAALAAGGGPGLGSAKAIGAGADTPITLGIYAANFNGSTVTEYSVRDTGNVAPLRTLGGPHTGIGNIRDVKVDAGGYIYTVNLSGPNFIGVFAPTATGDAVPIRQIGGIDTGLSDPLALAIDTRGYIYIANQTQGGAHSILVFSPGARGDAAPIRRITGAGEAVSLAIDGAGELVVGATSSFSQGTTNQILVYAPGADGPATPVRRIVGPSTALGATYSVGPLAVAVLPGGMRVRAVVSGTSPRVNVYANAADGNAAPQFSIVGPATGLGESDALAVDASGRSFVANAPADTIATFAATASGDTSPVRSISGPNTGLNYPIGLSVGPR